MNRYTTGHMTRLAGLAWLCIVLSTGSVVAQTNPAELAGGQTARAGAANAQPMVDTDAQRARILEERRVIEARFAVDERACYSRFAVTDCLTQKRRERRENISDLRRQEVLLNLADARARGSEQISRRERNVSTESLLRDAARLAEEQSAQAQRLRLMDERIAARQKALDQEAENTRQQMDRESQKRQADAQREARKSEEAANLQAYEQRQLAAQQKLQERLRRQSAGKP